GQRELELRAIERAPTRLHFEVDARCLRRRREQRLRPRPNGIRARAHRWPSGQGDRDLIEAEAPIEREQRQKKATNLARDVLLHAENMAVILSELPQPK